jgi:hypothetical protein
MDDVPDDEPVEYEPDPALTSFLYDWMRSMFLAPDKGTTAYIISSTNVD